MMVFPIIVFVVNCYIIFGITGGPIATRCLHTICVIRFFICKRSVCNFSCGKNILCLPLVISSHLVLLSKLVGI